MTYSYPRVTYSEPKLSHSDPKVSHSDSTHLPYLHLPHLTTAWPLVRCNETFGWVVGGGGGGWQPTLVLALGKGLSFEAFRLDCHPLPILA